jgi:hypothetical protein
MVIFIFTIEIASDLMDTDMLKIKANITHSIVCLILQRTKLILSESM